MNCVLWVNYPFNPVQLCLNASDSFPQSVRPVQGLLTGPDSRGVRDELLPPEPHSGRSGWCLSNSRPLFRPSQVHGGRRGGLQSALPAEHRTQRGHSPRSCSSGTRWVQQNVHIFSAAPLHHQQQNNSISYDGYSSSGDFSFM